MKEFKVIGKNEFETELRRIVTGLGLSADSIREITEAYNQNDMVVKERVYKIPTKQSNKAIIIYSSIDVRSDESRVKGSDAVRVVVWLRTEKGNFFKSFTKHLRINTIFKNLEKSITKINGEELKSFKGMKSNIKYV
jgi:hypothetical protein